MGVKLVVKFGWPPACEVEAVANMLATPKGTGSLETGVGVVVGSPVDALAAPPPETVAAFSTSPVVAVTSTLTANVSVSPGSTLLA